MPFSVEFKNCCSMNIKGFLKGIGFEFINSPVTDRVAINPIKSSESSCIQQRSKNCEKIESIYLTSFNVYSVVPTFAVSACLPLHSLIPSLYASLALQYSFATFSINDRRTHRSGWTN